MIRQRIPAIAAALALLAAFVAVPGLAAADGHSPVDAMLEDDEDDSFLPTSAADVAERVASVANTAEYSIDSTLSDDSNVTNASEQAKLTREAFNNRTWADYYNAQGYPTDTGWNVIAIHYEGEDSSETDYLVLTYDDSGNVSSAEIVDTHDGDIDAEQTVSGPLVHSYDDTREAHELVAHVHSEYVETGDDITEDSAFLADLGQDYAGHTEGDLSP